MSSIKQKSLQVKNPVARGLVKQGIGNVCYALIGNVNP